MVFEHCDFRIIRASLRYASVPYMTRDGAQVFHPEMHRYKTAWYSIRPTHDFQAVKFGSSKGGPGASAASRGGSGVPGVGGR